MRLRTAFIAACSLLAAAPAAAERYIKSTALQTCMDDSDFSASLFNLILTPNNRTVSLDVVATSTLSGNISAHLEVFAYGISIFNYKLDPCDLDISQLCPISPGQFDIETDFTLSQSVINDIPGIAFTMPDLDGTAKVRIYDDNSTQVACVQAVLSNGKTVDNAVVKWVTAVIAGIALIVSAFASASGHSSTAAHIAANGLSLFGYFQNVAIIGMGAMKLPPMTAAWVQDFQWTMGIIRVGFMQDIFNWYIKATGGTPTTLLQSLSSVSILIQKRSLEYLSKYSTIAERSNNDSDLTTISSTYVLHGFRRIAYLAGIEITNLFLTGFVFFLVFSVFITLALCLVKLILEGLSKVGAVRFDRFAEFRQRWLTIIKGTMYRLVLVGFPQMTILSLWELTRRDSPATIVLAIVMFLMVIGLIGWAAFKVIRLAQRSVAIHKNPAYILYSDSAALNRWGFIYVQFRATAYYFIIPVLLYMFVKACFIAFGQSSGTTQGIVLMIVELFYLVLLSYYKPYMDRRTNIFNITIQAVNFTNALLFFFFTGVTKVPSYVTGVMGVIFFILNAAFSLILLIMILVSCTVAIMSKNPDTRYQPMKDDRASFIKSTQQLPEVLELEALGATVRGNAPKY
ncbi:DUF907 domain-containing protein [Myxozyma melibiosi]|uniref:DUF907 domain-containing protein n=1 Tax=Myxozyma melibiosi TaxID=54550 RepID=A0ABR1FDT1_9ASCO